MYAGKKRHMRYGKRLDLGDNAEHKYGELPENFDPWLHRLLISLKVVGTDTDRSDTYDFLFRDKGSIFKIFPPPFIFNAQLRGFPLKFCKSGRAEEIEWCPYQTVNKCSFRYTQYWRWTDRRTDGQTDGIGKTVSLSACVGRLTRDRK